MKVPTSIDIIHQYLCRSYVHKMAVDMGTTTMTNFE
jgi:hypothetical protein